MLGILKLYRRLRLNKDIRNGICKGPGQRYCREYGYHSWFHHSQDSMSSVGNLPEGFIEP